MAKASFFEA